LVRATNLSAYCGMDPIPDQELERLAAEHGPGSVEANALAELRRERAPPSLAHKFLPSARCALV
jgi:hypothetical protein